MRLGDDLVHEGAHARIALEVAADVVARFLARDVQVARESEVADAVDDAKVDGLGGGAQLMGDIRFRDVVDLGRGGAVNVCPGQKRLLHGFIACNVGQNAQLDLRVIGRQQVVIPLTRLKERADHASFLCTHGDVLEVRIGA